ncbi:MAG: Trk system potassium transporter TrkA [Natronomonas sp.]|jgi:trk system potassium uptake protein TrkA|uniref:Trk system potassium transporter TrkA n=1 Tax=Natronomonas salsuginis TaxID=2217661 RepID=A0A4U5JA90_9EURY|nr:MULTISPECIES: Trk system potassium transporter TrkA [Natronomonas]MDR9380256.1 Trk system potassium transporter TrkA [Natronomonas sp.]MDR9430698.1 Trk system potassium transporter TrkA [Natronomonas sp.]TKR26070.1 Trk system potassium transporter TrkA [Natronomonas salsuginis]
MRTVIVGAGEVGTSIARSLAADHDVVVIDIDPDRAEQLKYDLDVMTLTGDGTSLSTLRTANIEAADLFIASTDDDRTNLVACETAKTVGDPFTIARTKSVEYLETWELTEKAFGVDFMVCSDLLSAENIVRVIGLPSAVDVDPFAGGLVQMAEFEIGPESPVAGHTVAEADRFESLTFAGLFRDDELVLPRGDTVIKAGDRAVVIGSPESVQGFSSDIAPEATPGQADEIVVIGGSEIGYQTARLLEERDLSPRIIERDHARARKLAEKLPNTLVMEHDATDTEFLGREHVDEADIVIAALDSDERNLLVSMLAKRLGTDRVVAVVDNGEYVTLFEEIGIDVAINPRQVTAEEITRFTHGGVAENIAVLEGDQAEVLELELTDSSELIHRPIRDIAADIDADLVFGAITRNREMITPRGDTELQIGDHIIVFVESSFVDELTTMA